MTLTPTIGRIVHFRLPSRYEGANLLESVGSLRGDGLFLIVGSAEQGDQPGEWRWPQFSVAALAAPAVEVSGKKLDVVEVPDGPSRGLLEGEAPAPTGVSEETPAIGTGPPRWRGVDWQP